MKIVAAYVGRFAPFHKGHQMITDCMIKKYGIRNCLIMVASSNSYIERTPYTFAQRKKMIKTIYPYIRVIPLPDVKPRLKHFDGTTNKIWLKQIKDIEEKLKVRFIFYGGSKEDLEILAMRFKTYIPFSRQNNGAVSGTKIRKALESGDNKTLREMVDPKLLKYVIMGYNTFHGKRG